MAHIRSKVNVVRGDITKLAVDVIVNAANKSLLGGGGVDGAIHEAAGPSLYDECYDLNGCDVGEAKMTGAHGIKQAKGTYRIKKLWYACYFHASRACSPVIYVSAIIHTVGPRIFQRVEEEDRRLLSSCYEKSFDLAKKHGFRSISFPCISTGIYSFPNREAAEIVFNTTIKWLDDKENFEAIDKVIFCVFLKKDEDIYKEILSRLYSGSQISSEAEPDEISNPGKRESTMSGPEVKKKTAETAASESPEQKSDVDTEILSESKTDEPSQ